MTKQWGGRARLGPIDADVGPGQFILLQGANGSGKTTLLRLAATTVAPSTGRVRWLREGKALEGPAARSGLAMVAHTPLVYDELTSAENVAFFLRMHGRPAVEATTKDYLGRFGLADHVKARAQGLSRGQRQRLALACAFAIRPHYLFLDEPTDALDEEGRRRLAEELHHLPPTTTTILATHDPGALKVRATRHWRLVEGRLEEGHP